MGELFPEKEEGDVLGAGHVNRLSDVCRSVSGIRASGGMQLSQTRSSLSISGPGKWQQVDCEISNLVINDTDTSGSGFYLIKFRYWNTVDDEWAVDDDHEYELDTSDSDDAYAVGDKLVAYWDTQRRMFVPLKSAVSGDWFQLLTDLDGETYGAYANPGSYNTTTGFLSDPHSGDTDPIGAWTAIIIDGSGQVPAWRGDWVRVEALDFTVVDRKAYILTDRVSSQLTFWGALGDLALSAGGTAACVLYINGELRSKTVSDLIMLAVGQTVPKNTLIRATYVPNFRMFVFDNAPCQIDV